MNTKIFLVPALAIVLASCSKTEQQSNLNQQEPATEQATPMKSEPANNTVVLNATDGMAYDKNEIRVKGGEKVTLTLHHTGKLGKDTMGHNFVLIAQGVDLGSFASEAMAAKSSDYIPAAEAKKIIAHTRLLAGGESDTIEFEAPAPGTYDYLCTFPGHAAVMKGKFIVE